MRRLVFLSVLLGGLALADRPFPATWQSAPLETSRPDVQTWVTARYGRTNTTYTRFDLRLLVAQPVVGRLDTLYGVDLDVVPLGVISRTVDPRLTSVWRYALTSADDAVGLGLLAKVGLGFQLFDVEARLVVDKRVGNVLVAFNASAGRVFRWAGRTLDPGVSAGLSLAEAADVDTRFEQSLAVRYLVESAFSAGLELRGREALENGVYQGSALHLGPTFSYTSRRWWLSLGLSVQMGADKAVADRGNGEVFEVRDNERFGGRLVVGLVLD